MRSDDTLFSLESLVVDLAAVKRNHFLAGSDQRENDIEHSFSVALLCWYICEQQNLKLDTARVLKYALAHDFVERYAGDTNAFASKAEREEKVRRERAAAEKLEQEFSQFKELGEIIMGYETKTDEEALFVWTVDKMQALVLGELDEWRPYEELEITYEQFLAKHSELLTKASPYCREIFASLLEYCKITYYDQPK